MSGYNGWRDWIPPRSGYQPRNSQTTPQPPQGGTGAVVGKRRSKYGAEKTTVDGITFDSKKEAKRYQELKLREAAGEIERLEIQPVFVLYVPSISGQLMRAAKAMTQGGMFRIGEYRGDFAYYDCSLGHRVVEDVKSPATRKLAIYRWKKRHVMAQYGIEIREV